MEDKRIIIIRNWFELKLVRNIQVFIRFVNFYWHFIQDFSKIAALLILILKTLIRNINSAINDKKKNCSDDKILKTTKSKSASSKSVFLTFETSLAFI